MELIDSGVWSLLSVECGVWGVELRHPATISSSQKTGEAQAVPLPFYLTVKNFALAGEKRSAFFRSQQPGQLFRFGGEILQSDGHRRCGGEVHPRLLQNGERVIAAPRPQKA